MRHLIFLIPPIPSQKRPQKCERERLCAVPTTFCDKMNLNRPTTGRLDINIPTKKNIIETYILVTPTPHHHLRGLCFFFSIAVSIFYSTASIVDRISVETVQFTIALSRRASVTSEKFFLCVASALELSFIDHIWMDILISCTL